MAPLSFVAVFVLALLLPVARQDQEPPPASPAHTPVAPMPGPDGAYSLGRGVVPPRLIAPVDPEYSEAARRKRISARCEIAVVVDAEGHVTNVHVSRSAAEGQPPKLQAAAATLDEKATEAVRQYQFKPGLVHGRAVPVALHVEVTFNTY